MTIILNSLVCRECKVQGKVGGLANKVFGNFAYDMYMSEHEEKYSKVTLDMSVK